MLTKPRKMSVPIHAHYTKKSIFLYMLDTPCVSTSSQQTCQSLYMFKTEMLIPIHASSRVLYMKSTEYLGTFIACQLTVVIPFFCRFQVMQLNSDPIGDPKTSGKWAHISHPRCQDAGKAPDFCPKQYTSIKQISSPLWSRENSLGKHPHSEKCINQWPFTVYAIKMKECTPGFLKCISL